MPVVVFDSILILTGDVALLTGKFPAGFHCCGSIYWKIKLKNNKVNLMKSLKQKYLPENAIVTLRVAIFLVEYKQVCHTLTGILRTYESLMLTTGPNFALLSKYWRGDKIFSPSEVFITKNGEIEYHSLSFLTAHWLSSVFFITNKIIIIK